VTTIRLPLPPSANRYWRTTRTGRTYVSEEAQAYKAEVGWLARAEGLEMLEGEVSLSLQVYMVNKSADLTNRIKVLEDALNGVAYIDDNQVSEFYARKFQVSKAKRGEKREGYVLVTVEALEAA